MLNTNGLNEGDRVQLTDNGEWATVVIVLSRREAVVELEDGTEETVHAEIIRKM